jgi:hypothetical protein
MHASNLPRSHICLMQDFLRQHNRSAAAEGVCWRVQDACERPTLNAPARQRPHLGVAYGVADPGGRSRMAMMVAIGSREMPPSR